MEKKDNIFISELKHHISSNANTPRPHKRRYRSKTLLGIPVGWFALVISAFLVSGALLSFLWTTYSIKVENTITINGGANEAVSLYYDNILLSGTSLDISTMDTNVLNPGDHLVFPHTFRNENGHQFNITIDLSQLPLSDEPEDVWYGVDIGSYEEDGVTPLTEFVIPPETDYTFALVYDVDDLFANPLIPFPFLMNINIEVFDTTPVGLPDTYSFDGFYPLNISEPGVLGNDIAKGSGDMTAVLDTDVQHGILALNEDGGFTYTPTEGYIGADTFEYHPQIGEVIGYGATVTLNVLEHTNLPPVGGEDTVAHLTFMTPMTVNVLANDYDPEGSQLEIMGVGPTGTGITITIVGTYPTQQIQLYCGSGSPIYTDLWYIISDGTLTTQVPIHVSYY